MNNWFKKEMKFPNVCKICGTSLTKGTSAYMRKSDLSGKWEFCCQNCHKQAVDQEPETKQVKSFNELKNVLKEVKKYDDASSNAIIKASKKTTETIGEIKMKWIHQWGVKSKTSGKEYTVSLSNDGEMACDCMGWTRNRTMCKHIVETVEKNMAHIKSLCEHHNTPNIPISQINSRNGKKFIVFFNGLNISIPRRQESPYQDSIDCVKNSTEAPEEKELPKAPTKAKPIKKLTFLEEIKQNAMFA